MFTIYEALEPYAGRMGTAVKQQDFVKLIQWVLDASVAAGAQSFIGRLPIAGLRLAGSGSLFVANGEPTYTGWSTQFIAPSDSLADDIFLIAHDDTLPLILCARNRGDHYTVIIGIDDVMVDVGCAILAQYNPALYGIRRYTPESYRKIGQLSAKLAAEFSPELICSWVGLALQRPSESRLQDLYRGLGAAWLSWRGQTMGQKPTGSNTQVVTVNTAQQETLEVMGDKNNEQLMSRSYLVAGILEASSNPPAINSTATSAPTSATLKQVNFDAIMQDLFQDAFGGEISDPFQPAMTPNAPIVSNDNLFDTLTPVEDISDTSWLIEGSDDLDDWLSGYDDDTFFNNVPESNSNGQQVNQPAATITVDVPDANVEFLQYVNQELNDLRDKIMDAGLYRAVEEQPRKLLDAFISRSGDLMLLVDEMVYLRQMVEKVSNNIEDVDPHELLNALLITYAGEAERRGVDLHYAPDDDLPILKANIEAINRAVFMALEQAIDFAAPKGVVKIGATTRDSMFEFSLISSGKPLTPDDIQDLFKPSYLGAGGTANFGFAAVNPIIEAHRGRTTIENVDGGNRILIHLPIEPTRSKI